MDTCIGQYDHLEKTDPVEFAPGMPAIVAAIRCANYGTHRFMSEFVRQELDARPNDVLALGIKALLDAGAH